MSMFHSFTKKKVEVKGQEQTLLVYVLGSKLERDRPGGRVGEEWQRVFLMIARGRKEVGDGQL